MKNLIYFLEYCLFRAVAFFINLLPLRLAITLAKNIGTMLYHLMPKRRAIMLDNLRQAYKQEKSEKELEKIAIASMRELAKLAVEFIRIPQLAKDMARYTEIRGQEHVWKALEQKKGVIWIVSHFGNWELMAVISGGAGFPMNAIARPMKNAYVYNYIKRLRGAKGLKSIDKEGAARNTIKALKRNEVVAMLVDQHERQGGAWVDFFGRPASTNTLPAVLALKYDVPVVFTSFIRLAKDKFQQYYEAPFEIINTGDYEADVFANTQMFIKRIEDEVRKIPGDWLWMHRRWRQPPKAS